MRRVFLSSTARDLQEYRNAVFEAIQKCDGWHVVRMEDFGARAEMTDEFCRAKVAECNLFVGITAHYFGSSPKGSKKSYTQQEYDAAVETNRPRLMFVAPDDFKLPANLIENASKRKCQRDDCQECRAVVDRPRCGQVALAPARVGRQSIFRSAVQNLEISHRLSGTVRLFGGGTGLGSNLFRLIQ